MQEIRTALSGRESRKQERVELHLAKGNSAVAYRRRLNYTTYVTNSREIQRKLHRGSLTTYIGSLHPAGQ